MDVPLSPHGLPPSSALATCARNLDVHGPTPPLGQLTRFVGLYFKSALMYVRIVLSEPAVRTLPACSSTTPHVQGDGKKVAGLELR